MVGLDLMAEILRNAGCAMPALQADPVAREDHGMKMGRDFYEWRPESAVAHVEAVERHLICLFPPDRASGRVPLPHPEASSADAGGCS